MRISAEKDKNKKDGERLFICPAVPVIWQQRESWSRRRRKKGGCELKKKKIGPRTALFVGFSRHGPCGSWRLWGTAAYSPCSPRQNAAQEDRKEARLFFMDALSVCLTARLRQSNSTVRGRRGECRGGDGDESVIYIKI